MTHRTRRNRRNLFCKIPPSEEGNHHAKTKAQRFDYEKAPPTPTAWNAPVQPGTIDSPASATLDRKQTRRPRLQGSHSQAPSSIRGRERGDGQSGTKAYRIQAVSNGDNKRVDAERPRGGGRAIPRGATGELLGRRLGFDGRPRVRVAGLMAPAGCIWGGEMPRGVEVEDRPRRGALPNPSRRHGLGNGGGWGGGDGWGQGGADDGGAAVRRRRR